MNEQAKAFMYCWKTDSRTMGGLGIYHISLDGETTICGVRLKRPRWVVEESDGYLHGFHQTLCLNCQQRWEAAIEI